MENALERIRSVADYQFGKGTGIKLFPENTEIDHSKKTGRIRYLSLSGERLATYLPTDGLLSLSIGAAKLMAEKIPHANCFITIRSDIAKYVAEGGDVFSAHVVKIDDEIRSKDEVIVVDEKGKVVAVGRALLSSIEMKSFKTGVAVKVRHGATKRKSNLS
jgi:uncharacterized protein with predicted RNA binding PUA domain